MKRKGYSDEEQLRYAIEQGRCLLSFNVNDFVLLHYDFLRQGEAHHGIIVSKQLPVGIVLQKLLKLFQNHSPETLHNQLIFLS